MSQTPQHSSLRHTQSGAGAQGWAHSSRPPGPRSPSLGTAGALPHRPARAPRKCVAEGHLSDNEGTRGNAPAGASPQCQAPHPLCGLPLPGSACPPCPVPGLLADTAPSLPAPRTMGSTQHSRGRLGSGHLSLFFFRQEIIWFYLEAAGHMMERQVWHKITEVLAHHTIQIIRSLQFIRVFEFNSHFMCS